MQEKYEICYDLFHGYDFGRWRTASERERIRMLPGAMQNILEQKDGKERFIKAVAALSKAFALAPSH